MKKLSAIALVVAMGVGAGLVHDHAGSAQMQTLGRGSYADALVQEFMAKRLMNTLSDPDLDSRSTLLGPPWPNRTDANALLRESIAQPLN